MLLDERTSYDSEFIKFYINLKAIDELNKDISFLISKYQAKCDADFEKSWTKFEQMKGRKFEALYSELKPVGAWKSYLFQIFETRIVPEFFIDFADGDPNVCVDTISDLLFDVPMKIKLDDFLREMSLAYIITAFESYLENMLIITFNRCPQCLSSAKTITAEEIIKKTVLKEPILDLLVKKEIEEIMRQDIEQINRQLLRKFKFSISESSTNWQEFKERFYRRNILIHNFGFINDEYRKKTGFQSTDKKVDVTQEYLDATIRLFMESSRALKCKFEEKFDSAV